MVRSEYSVIYLHGFASGPKSTKAQYFAEKLEELGLPVQVPDLNAGDFSNLTLTSQLKVLEEAIAAVPSYSNLVLIGSSMGGLLATLKSPSLDRLSALILLAPGFGLPRRWSTLLGPNGLENWRQDGSVEVFHHGVEKNLPLNYGFIQDANQYQTDDLEVDVPCMVFHGEHDETVPIVESIRFAENNTEFVELQILDDDHQLLSSLESIWTMAADFLVRLGIIGIIGSSPEYEDRNDRGEDQSLSERY